MSATAHSASAQLSQTASPGQDFLPLKGTDYVEFYVGNARQSAYFYRAAFGMSLVAYAGPETGQRDRASYVLQQGKVRFVLTTALRSDSDIARHVDKQVHIAFRRVFPAHHGAEQQHVPGAVERGHPQDFVAMFSDALAGGHSTTIVGQAG